MNLIDSNKFIKWLDIGRLRNPNELCFSEVNVKNMIEEQPTYISLDNSGIEPNKIYKSIQCKRCKKMTLVRFLGTEYLDGGYTHYNKFADAPEGWGYQSDIGTLCETCNKEYNDILKNFMGGMKK